MPSHEAVKKFSTLQISGFSPWIRALVAGTSLRGAFSERMQAIKEVKDGGSIIVFIGEIHTLMGAGSSGESVKTRPMTATALAPVLCIGATTIDEFKKHVEKDPLSSGASHLSRSTSPAQMRLSLFSKAARPLRRTPSSGLSPRCNPCQFDLSIR